MNPRLRIFSLICASVALPFVGLLVGSLTEPHYQGRPLSYWLLEYRINQYANPTACEASAEAVRHIGTNALPCLVKWARYNEPRWRTRAYMQIFRVRWNRPQRWLFKLAEPLKPCRLGRPDVLAKTGFAILGPAAEPALPELIGVISDRHSTHSVNSVICCALKIGPASFAPLTKILTDNKHPAKVRCAIASELIYDSNWDQAWAPALELASKDSDASVAAAASRALAMR